MDIFYCFVGGGLDRWRRDGVPVVGRLSRCNGVGEVKVRLCGDKAAK